MNVLILMASGATAFLAPAAFPFPGGRRDSLRPPSRLTNTAGWWVAGPRGGVRGGVALLAKAKDQEAPPPPPPGSNLQTASLSEAREVLDEVLSQQWQRALDGEKLGAGVKHVVGGFSVVVRLPDRGVAFRLQPMKNLKAGLTWVAFYSMLYEAAKDPASVQEAGSADALFQPDRTVVLGRSSSSRKDWINLPITKDFQSARLRKATRKLAEHRRRLLHEGSAMFKAGKCTSESTCEIVEEEDGGCMEGPPVLNGIMFPTHWFWTKVGRPSGNTKVEMGGVPGIEDAFSHEPKEHDSLVPGAEKVVVEAGAVANMAGGSRGWGGFGRRMKGSELAVALLLRSADGGKGSSAVSNQLVDDGEPPSAVELSPAPVMTSVFPHAQGDVGGLCKRIWSKGATDDVTVLVLQSLLRGLRRLHAIGVPHGDLKAANVLYVGGHFCLTDLPALSWSATPVLTKDPVAHTLGNGKRLLCNDMWGAGIIALGLVLGFTEMDSVKGSLRRLNPLEFNETPSASRRLDAVSQNWLVVVLHLAVILRRTGITTAVDAGAASTKALTSQWLKRYAPAVSSKRYMEECKFVADRIAAAILKPDRADAVIESIAYCLDVTDVARNALGMPWPSLDETISESSDT